jgi:hypothetical protein
VPLRGTTGPEPCFSNFKVERELAADRVPRGTVAVTMTPDGGPSHVQLDLGSSESVGQELVPLQGFACIFVLIFAFGLSVFWDDPSHLQTRIQVDLGPSLGMPVGPSLVPH